MFSPIIPGVCYAHNRLHLCIWNYFYLKCPSKTSSLPSAEDLPIHSPFKTQPSHCFLWETFPISLRLWFYHQYLAHCLGQSWFLINAYWKNKWMSGLMDGFLPSLNWLSWAFESWVLRLEVHMRWHSISWSTWGSEYTLLAKVIKNGYLLQAKVSLHISSKEGSTVKYIELEKSYTGLCFFNSEPLIR